MVADIVDCPVCGGWGFEVFTGQEGNCLYGASCPACDGTGKIELLSEEE